MAKLKFNGKYAELETGKTLFDYADELGVLLPSSCGRVGACHECIVDIKKGADSLSARTEEESFLGDKFRLACEAEVVAVDCEIELHTLRRGAPQILTEGQAQDVELASLVTRSDGKVLYDGQPIADDEGYIYGVAVDIGTSTIAFNLVDLETGKTLSTSSFENPQIFGGSNVINRILYDKNGRKGELNRIVIAYMNNALADLKCDSRHIYEVVIAGNATMRDLFFNLDVQSIGVRPYMSQIETEYRENKRASTSLMSTARELGLEVNDNARVYGMPLIGCHVGADTAACLLAVDLQKSDKCSLLMDIGTNTEVVLGNREKLLCASCPAGPAFEGGGIADGMSGLAGAIETITLDNGKAEYSVIGGVEPEGICGSGIIDLLAELLKHGKMDSLGRLQDGTQKYVVDSACDISLAANEISELAQAKAANYCGQKILLSKFNIDAAQLEHFYLAGGFANYINVENAMGIGLIPEMPLEIVSKVGNASLTGATQALVSRHRRDELEELVKSIEHIELETVPEFFDIFVEGCLFKLG
jgi:uncharacterized 2Fe-2S/4Fe-4S cluster protein (DUF4445 family)